MINYVTKHEYTGQNADILADVGVDAVVTFKQAVRNLGIAGVKLKGIKSVATLVRYQTKKVKDENGKEKTIKRPTYFNVFDVNDVLARKEAA